MKNPTNLPLLQNIFNLILPSNNLVCISSFLSLLSLHQPLFYSHILHDSQPELEPSFLSWQHPLVSILSQHNYISIFYHYHHPNTDSTNPYKHMDDPLNLPPYLSHSKPHNALSYYIIQICSILTRTKPSLESTSHFHTYKNTKCGSRTCIISSKEPYHKKKTTTNNDIIHIKNQQLLLTTQNQVIFQMNNNSLSEPHPIHEVI